jgi:hypothetical protein
VQLARSAAVQLAGQLAGQLALQLTELLGALSHLPDGFFIVTFYISLHFSHRNRRLCLLVTSTVFSDV